MPRVSVNICCYNGERYIAETIRSVLAQTFRDLEIVVVNDGSKDATGEVVQALKDPRIKYFAQENRGLAETRNRAISLSGGEFIAILDQDDLWEPEKLERQLEIMDSKPGVGVVYSGAYIIDERGGIRGLGARRRNCRGRIGAALLRGNFIICPTVMFRADLLRKAGSFRTDCGIAEEYDMYLRLSRLCEFDFVDEPLARYRLHAGNSSRDMVKNYRETVMCLADFVASEPDGPLREAAKRQADANRLRLAAVLLCQGRPSDAQEALAQMESGGLLGAGGGALRLLARAPSWVARAAFAPLRAIGLVRVR